MKRTLLFSMVLVSGAGFILAQSDRLNKSNISVDKTPPLRTGPSGGYADVVSRVSPSIVSIFTSRESAPGISSSQDLPDLFNSPMFREFFDQRGMQRSVPRKRVPRQLPRQQGLGSGVILSEDGYILTNHHVVKDASDIRVKLESGKEHDAKIVAADPASDLAVIKVEARNLPSATIGDSESLLPGDTVLAIGSPFGLNQTVTSGIVSATGRDNLNIVGYENFIQTDASINPGNSGGALVDNKGRVVGINTAIFSRSGGNVGIGFAIPVNMAVNIAEELISHGEIVRGYLGVTLGELTEQLAEALEVKEHGVLINDVVEGAPADKAGFKSGDVIVKVNGKGVEDMADVRRMVGQEKPGNEVKFTVNRGREEMVLEAKIGRMPSDALASIGSSGSEQAPIEEGALQGVRLGRLDRETRDRLGLGREEEGVVVLDVAPHSKAAEFGLAPGQVITEVNREKVSEPREAIAKAKHRKGKAVLLRITDGKRNRFLAIG